MSTKMLIDARHTEETRVTIVRGSRVEEFDYENIARKQLKGSIYLARVTRVEPSLQAAFVEYGGNRHGFLAFSEIHPDYYQIPVEDREALIAEMTEAVEKLSKEEQAREAGDLDDEDEDTPTRSTGRSPRGRRSRRPVSDTPDEMADEVPEGGAEDGAENGAENGPESGAEGEAEEGAGDATQEAPQTLSDQTEDAALDTRDGDNPAPSDASDALDDEPTVVTEEDPETPEDPEKSEDPDQGDVMAEDTGADEDQPSVTQDLPDSDPDSDMDDAAQKDVTPQDAPVGESGLITLEQPLVDEDGESLEETVAQAIAASANWSPDKAEESEEEDRGRRTRRRRSRRPKRDQEDQTADADQEDDQPIKQKSDAELVQAVVRRRMLKTMRRRYSIQEVIKKRQILLVQVAKEERGNKGAALTTYISLAGRYCVLMPNSTHAGGVSRKISSASDRRRLKSVISNLDMPSDMGLIIRTAGMTRTRAEIKRDYDYLLRLWNDIRSLTLSSVAPKLIYEEADLIRRSIRDMYTRDVDEILVEGERGYNAAKGFMKLLVPSAAKKVQHYNNRIPLFQRFQVEQQLESMFQPSVTTKSGGYVVINPTEALISIDVNSGRSTKEHNIEETALKTNLEAADEIARQLRLRDMAGLVVIDFIDMEDRSNIRAVEKRMKDAVKTDRARIQIGRISSFGLMEMSRQRLRPNLLEASTVECSHCKGTGIVLSLEAAALQALRKLEEEGIRARSSTLQITAHPDVAGYLLNSKRAELLALEKAYGVPITVAAEIGRSQNDSELSRTPGRPARDDEMDDTGPAMDQGETGAITADADQHQSDETAREEGQKARDTQDDEDERPRRRRRRRRGRRRDEEGTEVGQDGEDGDQDPSPNDGADKEPSTDAETGKDDSKDEKPRRRRGRRGGRRKDSTEAVEADDIDDTKPETNAQPAAEADTQTDVQTDAQADSQADSLPDTVADPAADTANEQDADLSDTVDGGEAAAPEVPSSEESAPLQESAPSDASDAAPVADKQPVSSTEIEVKMVSETSDIPKKKGWWSRIKGD